jgi:hypothetical protein
MTMRTGKVTEKAKGMRAVTVLGMMMAAVTDWIG